MKTKFKVTNVEPFDLMRWGIDSFYDYLNQEYRTQYGREMEILEASCEFIKGGLSVKIIAFKNL